ncbi:thiamine pyrophosphate-binding protein, partial [Cribrihabitans sp. XS_ASV171]
MTGAELFIQCLAAGGIDTVYALPGEETSALMDALEASDIDLVLCRHEQAAAFMASAHGRLTGRPAACLATLGPGATNLVTGVADATLDHVPMLAITGQGGRERIGRDSHQMLDLARLFEPVTKRSRTVMEAGRIPGAVAEALHVATAPRPGAVHLSLPEDVADGPAEEVPLAPPPAAPVTAHADSIAAMARHLAEARRPFALIGAGVLRDHAVEAVRGFLDETGMPAATSFMAKGVLPDAAPCNLGAFGLPTVDHVDRAIDSADLLVTIGLDPVEYPLSKLTDAGRIPVLSLAETS